MKVYVLNRNNRKQSTFKGEYIDGVFKYKARKSGTLFNKETKSMNIPDDAVIEGKEREAYVHYVEGKDYVAVPQRERKEGDSTVSLSDVVVQNQLAEMQEADMIRNPNDNIKLILEGLLVIVALAGMVFGYLYVNNAKALFNGYVQPYNTSLKLLGTVVAQNQNLTHELYICELKGCKISNLNASQLPINNTLTGGI